MLAFAQVEALPGRRIRKMDGSPALWEKALRSIAFRSGPIVYRRLLRAFPAPRLPAKPPLPIPMLTMCGRRHLEMLEQSLYSIALKWSCLPDVTVIADGTEEPSKIAERLKWWPGKLSAEPWETSSAYHQKMGRSGLVAYAERHPFGRKLSAILAASERNRFLWVDCDILFYSDFTPLIRCEANGIPSLSTTQDWCYGYDPKLIGTLPHLLTRPPVNTGVAVYEGNLYDVCKLAPLIERTADYCDNFTEQTILAQAVFKLGRIAWGLEVIRIFDHDKYSLAPSFVGRPWIARHYVTNVRHLFWRDALALRLGAR